MSLLKLYCPVLIVLLGMLVAIADHTLGSVVIVSALAWAIPAHVSESRRLHQGGRRDPSH